METFEQRLNSNSKMQDFRFQLNSEMKKIDTIIAEILLIFFLFIFEIIEYIFSIQI